MLGRRDSRAGPSGSSPTSASRSGADARSPSAPRPGTPRAASTPASSSPAACDERRRPSPPGRACPPCSRPPRPARSARPERRGDEAVAAAAALGAVQHEQRGVATRASSLLDAALHALGERVARLLDARAGRPAPAASRSPSRSPLAIPRIARRVVCGLSETIATFAPTSAFTSVDLPTFGRPATATKPGRVGSSPREVTLASAVEDLRLQREHLAAVGLVVVARPGAGRRGRPPPRGRACAPGRSRRRRARAGPAPGRRRRRGKASTSVGSSMPRCARFSSRIRSLVDELDASGGRPRARPRRARRAAARAQLARALELDHSSLTGRRSSGVAAAASERLRAAAARAAALRVRRVGVHDPLDELVPHDVLAAEVDERRCRATPIEDVAHDHQAGALVAGQVDLGDVARSRPSSS